MYNRREEFTPVDRDKVPTYQDRKNQRSLWADVYKAGEASFDQQLSDKRDEMVKDMDRAMASESVSGYRGWSHAEVDKMHNRLASCSVGFLKCEESVLNYAGWSSYQDFVAMGVDARPNIAKEYVDKTDWINDWDKKLKTQVLPSDVRMKYEFEKMKWDKYNNSYSELREGRSLADYVTLEDVKFSTLPNGGVVMPSGLYLDNQNTFASRMIDGKKYALASDDLGIGFVEVPIKNGKPFVQVGETIKDGQSFGFQNGGKPFSNYANWFTKNQVHHEGSKHALEESLEALRFGNPYALRILEAERAALIEQRVAKIVNIGKGTITKTVFEEQTERPAPSLWKRMKDGLLLRSSDPPSKTQYVQQTLLGAREAYAQMFGEDSQVVSNLDRLVFLSSGKANIQDFVAYESAAIRTDTQDHLPALQDSKQIIEAIIEREGGEKRMSVKTNGDNMALCDGGIETGFVLQSGYMRNRNINTYESEPYFLTNPEEKEMKRQTTINARREELGFSKSFDEQTTINARREELGFSKSLDEQITINAIRPTKASFAFRVFSNDDVIGVYKDRNVAVEAMLTTYITRQITLEKQQGQSQKNTNEGVRSGR